MYYVKYYYYAAHNKIILLLQHEPKANRQTNVEKGTKGARHYHGGQVLIQLFFFLNAALPMKTPSVFSQGLRRQR